MVQARHYFVRVEGFRVDTLVTNRLIQYAAAELAGAYVRPPAPGVSAC
jgi:hypothetical protein